jgi:EmrB/QacA subfamily drug resistance transporter
VRLGKSGGGVAAATALQAAADRQAAAAHQPWGETLSRRRIRFVLTSVLLGMLLAALDQAVVSTAMPRIITELNGLQHYAWVATAYLLASAASMPIWGKLSDAYGRKRYFIAGMVVFITGSALCGQSHNMVELIAFRGLQGLGAGAMMPISQAIVGDIFPPAQRAKWAGVMMSVFGVATIIGPLVGGWITDNIGWRWVFYVNMPVGVIAVVFAIIALPGHVSLRRHIIDYVGASVLVLAAVPLLLAFSWAGTTYAWGSWEVVGAFVFSIVMWIVFFLREMRAAEPILNPRLFENGIFAVSALASTLQSAAMFGAIMFLPLFVQGVLGRTATNSGIVLMPMMLSAMVTSIVGGQLLARTGRYKALVIFGFAAVTVGAYLLAQMGETTTQATLALNMVIMGLGLGIAMSAFTVIVQNQYPTHRLGEVTAGLQFFRSIGSTIGLAIFGTILATRFPSELAKAMHVGKVPAALSNPQVLVSPDKRVKIHESFVQQIVDKILNAKLSGLPGGHRQMNHAWWHAPLGQAQQKAESAFIVFMNNVRHALDAAIIDVFRLAVVVGVLGFVSVLFLREERLRRTHALVDAEAEGVPEPQVAAEGVEG